MDGTNHRIWEETIRATPHWFKILIRLIKFDTIWCKTIQYYIYNLHVCVLHYQFKSWTGHILTESRLTKISAFWMILLAYSKPNNSVNHLGLMKHFSRHWQYSWFYCQKKWISHSNKSGCHWSQCFVLIFAQTEPKLTVQLPNDSQINSI